MRGTQKVEGTGERIYSRGLVGVGTLIFGGGGLGGELMGWWLAGIIAGLRQVGWLLVCS